MHSIALLSLPLLGSVAASESVTSLFLPDFDAATLLGSVMGTSGSTTTFFVYCAPGTSADECVISPGVTAIDAPKTAELIFGDEHARVSAHVKCDLSNPDVAICVETIGGESALYPGTTTGSFTGADIKSLYVPVTIVSGATSTGAPTASKTSASASAGATTAAPSVTMLTGTRIVSTDGSATSTSTGGVPRVTGGARWAAGGAAVALALAGL